MTVLWRCEQFRGEREPVLCVWMLPPVLPISLPTCAFRAQPPRLEGAINLRCAVFLLLPALCRPPSPSMHINTQHKTHRLHKPQAGWLCSGPPQMTQQQQALLPLLPLQLSPLLPLLPKQPTPCGRLAARSSSSCRSCCRQSNQSLRNMESAALCTAHAGGV